MSPLETGTTHVTYLLRCPYCQTFYSRESSFPFFFSFFFFFFFVKKTIRVKHSLSAVSTGQRIFYEFDLRGLSFTSRLNHPGRQPTARSLEVSQLVVACATV